MRCVDFKTWADQCAPRVEVYLKNTSAVQYDATLLVKSVFPYQELMGTVYVDIVDAYFISANRIPHHYHVITQNQQQALLFNKTHTTHIIGHSYTNCDKCSVKPEGGGFSQERQFTALSLCNLCAPNLTEMGEDSICLELIDESRSKNFFEEAMLRKKCSCGEMTPKHNLSCHSHISSNYGNLKSPGEISLAYHEVFKSYDALVVFSKRKDKQKLQYGSFQRVLNQMRSGVPVLVEKYGYVHSSLIDHFNYTCSFTMEEQNTSTWSLREALLNLKQNDYIWKSCRKEGLMISQKFSPSWYGRTMLRSMGYQGHFLC